MEIKIIIDDRLLEKDFNDVGILCNNHLIMEFKEWMKNDFWEWYRDNMKSFLIEKVEVK